MTFSGVLFSFILQGSLLLCVSGQQSKPNIVILFTDDLGYGDLGCYGHPYATTPNIDALASEGLRFTDFYAGAPVCSPSRATLLTGRYHTRSGVWPGVFLSTSIGGLPLNETTVAEYVKEAGYSTAMVGKWHLGVGLDGKFLPTHQGFDYYLGIPYSNNQCPCTGIACFYPDVPCYGSCNTNVEESPCPLYENTTIIEQPADFLTLDEKYVSAATSFIKREAANQNPFLLYMAFQHTHTPQYAGKEFTDSSVMGRFGDAVNELDAGVGSIMAAIKEAGIETDTFVFFASDNGPELMDEVRGGIQGALKCGKGTTYEGGQREPGIAWWPGMIKPGRTFELASTLDLLPTILNLAGVEAKEGVTLDGYDMGPILFEGKESLREDFYYYPFFPDEKDGVFAVRHKQYKAHFITQGTPLTPLDYPDRDCRVTHFKTTEDPPLLFDMYSDVGERYTLTPADPEYTDTMNIISKMGFWDSPADYFSILTNSMLHAVGETLKVEEKDLFNADMVWGESQINLGEDPSLAPCASPGCFPFPSCCHTSTVESLHCTAENCPV